MSSSEGKSTLSHASNKSITLVLGGVRSGKSDYAERLAAQASRVVYVATAEAFDDEMRIKIARHREARPGNWLTVEEPLALAKVIAERGQVCDLLLIDCVTIFASNLLHAYEGDAGMIEKSIRDLGHAMQGASASVVLVSNEVGSGVVPAYALGRRYRDLLGEINQRLAALSDTTVLMVAGLPMLLKGKLEEIA